jgi:hypothetical protein
MLILRGKLVENMRPKILAGAEVEVLKILISNAEVRLMRPEISKVWGRAPFKCNLKKIIFQ